MRSQVRMAVVSALLLAGCKDTSPGEVVIEGAYARASAPGAPNGAVFMTVRNRGHETAIVGASSPASEVVELHTHVHEEGVMKMRRIPRIDIPGGGEVTLEPGGLHLMLIGLTRPLEVGSTVSLTLTLADGEALTVEAPVRDVGTGAPADHAGPKGASGPASAPAAAPADAPTSAPATQPSGGQP